MNANLIHALDADIYNTVLKQAKANHPEINIDSEGNVKASKDVSLKIFTELQKAYNKEYVNV